MCFPRSIKLVDVACPLGLNEPNSLRPIGLVNSVAVGTLIGPSGPSEGQCDHFLDGRIPVQSIGMEHRNTYVLAID